MSTVLWANLLIDGVVNSDQSDHYALYRHADKLEAITNKLGLASFKSICDTTDVAYNLGSLELPVGAKSSDEIMAMNGAWLPLGEAIKLLESLKSHIEIHQVRFGFLKNQHTEVMEELTEVIEFAKQAPNNANKFNFSVVT